MSLLAAFLLTVFAALHPAQRSSLEKAIEWHRNARWQQAIEEYQRILAENDFPPARIYLAQALWLSGRREEAGRELDRARSKAPELLLPSLLLSHLEGRDLPELTARISDPNLRARLRPMIDLERERLVPIGAPSLYLLSLGAVEMGIRDYHIASALDPGDASLHRQVGSALLKIRRPLEAVEAFEKAVALSPEDEASWQQLGSAHLLLMRWESAIEAYEKVRALGKEDPSLLLALGYAYERRTSFDQALELYEKASRLSPSSSQPHYRIGRLQMSRSELWAAEKSFRRAAELAPEMPEPVTYLGAVHLQQGAVDEALSELERAVELDPKSYEAYYHLAQAYRRSGRIDEARKALATYEELKRRYGGRPPLRLSHSQSLPLELEIEYSWDGEEARCSGLEGC